MLIRTNRKKAKNINRGATPRGQLEIVINKNEAVSLNDLQNKQIYDIDLGLLIPDIENLGPTLPRVLRSAVTGVLDEYLTEDKEVYYESSPRNFSVCFSKQSRELAKLKMHVIESCVTDAVVREIEKRKFKKVVANKSEGNSAQNPLLKNIKHDEDALSRGGVADRSRLEEREFEREEEEKRKWATRALENMVPQSRLHDVLGNMASLIADTKVDYIPVWHRGNNMICGFFCKNRIEPDQSDKEALANQNLGILGSTVKIIKEVLRHRKMCIFIVPLDVRGLEDSSVREVYDFYVRSLPEQVKRCLVIEVSGSSIGINDMSLPVGAILGVLRAHCRSIIVNTGKIAKIAPQMGHIDPQAFGFDIRNINLPDSVLEPLFHEFREYYKDNGFATYVLGINSTEMLALARTAKFNYISGSAVSELNAD